VGKFRVRNGEREIEYEGEDSTIKFEQAVNLLGISAQGPTHKTVEQIEQNEFAKRNFKEASQIPVEGFVLPKKGKLGILEFGEKEVRFPAQAISVLTFEQAIGLLLFEVNAPLLPSVITFLIGRGFKKSDPRNIRAYLTSGHFKLKRYVIKEQAGYRLTGEGMKWVQDEILPKLQQSVERVS
jgi:hypothetical protein